MQLFASKFRFIGQFSDRIRSSLLKLKLYILRLATPTPCHCEEAQRADVAISSGQFYVYRNSFGEFVPPCREIATGASALAMTVVVTTVHSKNDTIGLGQSQST